MNVCAFHRLFLGSAMRCEVHTWLQLDRHHGFVCRYGVIKLSNPFPCAFSLRHPSVVSSPVWIIRVEGNETTPKRDASSEMVLAYRDVRLCACLYHIHVRPIAISYLGLGPHPPLQPLSTVHRLHDSSVSNTELVQHLIRVLNSS
jgi:hypothetical protein